VVPTLFAIFLLAAPGPRARATSEAGRFLKLWALVFSIETVIDPFSTGPLVEVLDLGYDATSAVMLLFVLLGDFRVFALVFFLADAERRLGRSLGWAAGVTLIVPVFAYAANSIVESLWPELAAQRLWLIYELSFLTLALVLRERFVSRGMADRPELQAGLRQVLTYVAAYYALWATADVLILYAGLDAGWLLRVLPNQLYYAFFVPFAWMVLSPVLAREP
jgi:hypothetical protein